MAMNVEDIKQKVFRPKVIAPVILAIGVALWGANRSATDCVPVQDNGSPSATPRFVPGERYFLWFDCTNRTVLAREVGPKTFMADLRGFTRVEGPNGSTAWIARIDPH